MSTTLALRRLAATGALLMLVPLVAACGSSASSTASPAASSGPQTLVVYSAEPDSVAGYQAALAPFEKQNNVTVKFNSYPSADFLTQFPNAVRSNQQIDVLLANGQDVRTLAAKDLLAPLENAIDPATMIPPAIDPFKIKDQQFAVGVNSMYTTALAFNQDLMTKYALAAPKTFDDLKANVAKLQGSGVSLIAVPGGNKYLWPIWYMQTLQQASGGKPSELTDKTLRGDVPFTDPQYVNAMTALQELGKMGAFQPGFAAATQDSAIANVVQQKSVMYYGGTWDISPISQKAKFPLGVTFFPSNVPGVEQAPAGGAAIAAAVYSKVAPERKDLATKLVQYLASSEGETATIVATKTGFPLPTAVGVTVPSSPTAKEVATTIAPKTFTFLDWYWPKQVTAAFQEQILAVVGGKTDPAAAMQAVQAAFDQAKADGWTY